MNSPPAPTPVGVMEIAARAGVTEIAVRKWVARHGATSAAPFPHSIGPVSGRGAYWWHQVVEWLATTGRLARVARLERPDEHGVLVHHVTIRYDAVAGTWILAAGDDDTAIHSWDQPPEHPGRPWMHRDEDELVAEIREMLLDGWHVV